MHALEPVGLDEDRTGLGQIDEARAHASIHDGTTRAFVEDRRASSAGLARSNEQVDAQSEAMSAELKETAEEGNHHKEGRNQMLMSICAAALALAATVDLD